MLIKAKCQVQLCFSNILTIRPLWRLLSDAPSSMQRRIAREPKICTPHGSALCKITRPALADTNATPLTPWCYVSCYVMVRCHGVKSLLLSDKSHFPMIVTEQNVNSNIHDSRILGSWSSRIRNSEILYLNLGFLVSYNSEILGFLDTSIRGFLHSMNIVAQDPSTSSNLDDKQICQIYIEERWWLEQRKLWWKRGNL